MFTTTVAEHLNEFINRDSSSMRARWAANPRRYWGYYSATLQLKDAFTLKQFRDSANNVSNGQVWGSSKPQVLRPSLRRRLVHRQRPLRRRSA